LSSAAIYTHFVFGQHTSSASRWCSASKYQHQFDADLPAIIELLSIMHRFTGEIQRVGYEVIWSDPNEMLLI
jgi:hypothetical protein